MISPGPGPPRSCWPGAIFHLRARASSERKQASARAAGSSGTAGRRFRNERYSFDRGWARSGAGFGRVTVVSPPLIKTDRGPIGSTPALQRQEERGHRASHREARHCPRPIPSRVGHPSQWWNVPGAPRVKRGGIVIGVNGAILRATIGFSGWRGVRPARPVRLASEDHIEIEIRKLAEQYDRQCHP